MKSFFRQIEECKVNKTIELLKNKEPEVIYFRPNSGGIGSITHRKAYFCNKHMKRCSSRVCEEERKIEHKTQLN